MKKKEIKDNTKSKNKQIEDDIKEITNHFNDYGNQLLMRYDLDKQVEYKKQLAEKEFCTKAEYEVLKSQCEFYKKKYIEYKPFDFNLTLDDKDLNISTERLSQALTRKLIEKSLLESVEHIEISMNVYRMIHDADPNSFVDPEKIKNSFQKASSGDLICPPIEYKYTKQYKDYSEVFRVFFLINEKLDKDTILFKKTDKENQYSYYTKGKIYLPEEYRF